MGTIASSLGSAHSLLLTPGALWAGVCVWAGLEVAFYFLLAYVIHPRLEPPRQAPQGPLPPRECLARLVDTLERLKGVSECVRARGHLTWRDRSDERGRLLIHPPTHPSTHPPIGPMHRPQVYPAERFWSGWFRGAPFADIHRENVKVRRGEAGLAGWLAGWLAAITPGPSIDGPPTPPSLFTTPTPPQEFLCWAVWHVEAWELAESPEEAAALEEGVQALERAQGRPFLPGHNPRVSHVAFTREPLRFSHRLLAYYVLVKLGQLVGHTLLRLRGHRRHATRSGLTYWHRPCQQPGPVKQVGAVWPDSLAPVHSQQEAHTRISPFIHPSIDPSNSCRWSSATASPRACGSTRPSWRAWPRGGPWCSSKCPISSHSSPLTPPTSRCVAGRLAEAEGRGQRWIHR